jgi:hypothetical protein
LTSGTAAYGNEYCWGPTGTGGPTGTKSGDCANRFVEVKVSPQANATAMSFWTRVVVFIIPSGKALIADNTARGTLTAPGGNFNVADFRVFTDASNILMRSDKYRIDLAFVNRLGTNI